jgi:hypothetical protein
MNETKLIEYLSEVLDFASSEDGMIAGIGRMDIFDSAGNINKKKGLVLKMKTGEVFSLSVEFKYKKRVELSTTNQ